MNKKPVYYMQTDKRWASLPYRVKGEDATIGGSGCGPACAAMLIETITGKPFSPVEACQWSMEHGYKALNQGTYYSYFKPQFKEFGITCEQLGWTNTYGKPGSSVHEEAFRILNNGYYLIALMGKGLWTNGGHFVVVWHKDGKVYINDPASKRIERLEGNVELFKSQVKYYWWVYDSSIKEEEEEMDQNKFNGLFDVAMKAYLKNLSSEIPSEWAIESIERVVKRDITDGLRPQSFATRQEVMMMIDRISE